MDRAAIYRVTNLKRIHEKAIHATLLQTVHVHEVPHGRSLPDVLVLDYESDEAAPKIGALLKVTVSDVL